MLIITRLKYILCSLVGGLAVLTSLAVWPTQADDHYSKASTLPALRVAVLSFGTINWEMKVISQNKLDQANGFRLEVVKVANKNAAAIALQSGAVDVIMTDLFWVAQMRGDYQIFPTHKLTGGIYARPDIKLTDPQFRLGIAGGANDKNWMVLKTYLQQPRQIDGNAFNINQITPVFAAPPLLNVKAQAGEVDGAINFWHYNARLEAKGFVKRLALEDMLNEMGIKNELPLLGWVFADDLAAQRPQLIDGFIQASTAAKRLLLNNPALWQQLKPLMKAEDEATFERLVAAYPYTLITVDNGNNTTPESLSESAQQFFRLVAAVPQQTMIKGDETFQEDWLYFPSS